jgi:hypothetical protein
MKTVTGFGFIIALEPPAREPFRANVVVLVLVSARSHVEES